MNLLMIIVLIACALPESMAACDVTTYTQCLTSLTDEFTSASNDIARLCSLLESFPTSAQPCLTHLADCEQEVSNAYANSISTAVDSYGSQCVGNQQPGTSTGDQSCLLDAAGKLINCVGDLSTVAELGSQLGNLESGQNIESYCGLVEDGTLRDMLACMAPIFEECPALLDAGGTGQSVDLTDLDAQLAMMEALCTADCPDKNQALANSLACFTDNNIEIAEDFVARSTCSKLDAIQTCLENKLANCQELYGLIIATSSASYGNNDIMFLQNAIKSCDITPSSGFTYYDPATFASANGVSASMATFFFCFILTLLM